MYPDPVLTANIYCSGRLDEVLHHVVAPSWRAIRLLDADAETWLWTLRSPEGGDHLKVRLHGPAALAEPARVLLQQSTTAFFSHLDTATGERSVSGWKVADATDVDDTSSPAHADRSLVWTRYRRSHVWLGGGPFLDDDGYVGRITRCLSAACDRVLLLELDASGKIPHRMRQGTLLEALVAGLSISGFEADARQAYLVYHRDTLLRSHARAEATRRQDILQLFERRIESMGASVDVLRLAAQSVWARDHTEDGLEGAVAVWCRALAHLVWYIRPLCEDPDYRIDPQASDPCFVPVFKVFHGLANQLGLNVVEEAFAHHVLAAVSAPASAPSPQ